MIAQDDTSMNEAVKTAIQMNENWELREAMIRREIYNNKVKRLEQSVAEQEAQLAEQEAEIAEKDALIEQLKKQLEEKNNK